jgi:small subunit ribosomal protein S1
VEKEDTSEMGALLAKVTSFYKMPAEGDLIKGYVISASPKEVLVDIEGLTTGIIRGKEMFQEESLYEAIKVGDEIEATVMDLENEMGMIELSFRFAGHQKAWENLNKLKEENRIVQAKVLDANKGGLLVSINHVNGFIPVSQLNPEHYPRVPGGDKNKILEKLKSYVGQLFDVKVIDADAEQEKLIVSEKSAWEETQKDILDKHKVGEVIEGTITAVTEFGIFVKFGENLEGLVHISELAWQRIDNPNDLFKVGETIKAEIINIEGSKIFLSIKKLQHDPWLDINERYNLNQMVEGKVLKVNPFGLFVELDRDIHGLAHISELSDKPISSVDDIAKAGDTMQFRIVSIEPNEHRLGLSLKKESKKEEKPEEIKEATAENTEAETKKEAETPITE